MPDSPEIAKLYRTGECPYCGSKEFYEGPSGGMSTNWYCANEECGAGFNLTGMAGFGNQVIRAPKSKAETK